MTKILRNTVAVIAGVLTYLIIDTLVGIPVGLLLFHQHSLKIIFYIVMRYIVCVINIRAMRFVINSISIRNSNDYCVPSLIVGILIIILTVSLIVLALLNKSFDTEMLVCSIFGIIIGIFQILCAKSEIL